MPWILQMVGFMLLLLGIGFALWVSLWLLLFLFGLGIVFVIATHVRDYLTQKGILNPTPGVPMEPQAQDLPIIEGDFQRMDAPSVTQEAKIKE